MLRVNEERRAFSCVGYPLACAVAGPHGPVFLPMAILQTRRVYIYIYIYIYIYKSPVRNRGDEACYLGLNGDKK